MDQNAEPKPKRECESRTEQIQIVMPGDTNGNGRLFGGRLAAWIDVVAAVSARRHSGREVTTVSIQNLHFKSPAYVNETVVLIGRVIFTGRTSVEVRVDTYAEKLCGERNVINTAYIIMVALDENEMPARVPRLLIETEEQQREWDDCKKRREIFRGRNWKE